MIPKTDLGVEEWDLYFVVTKHPEIPLLVTRTHMSDPGPMGPLVCECWERG